jgi:hypothetical protein
LEDARHWIGLFAVKSLYCTRGWSRPTSKKAPAVSSRLRVEGDQGQEPQAFNTTPNSTAIMHIPYTRLNTLKYYSISV